VHHQYAPQGQSVNHHFCSEGNFCMIQFLINSCQDSNQRVHTTRLVQLAGTFYLKAVLLNM
jgi:hypothetical protein